MCDGCRSPTGWRTWRHRSTSTVTCVQPTSSSETTTSSRSQTSASPDYYARSSTTPPPVRQPSSVLAVSVCPLVTSMSRAIGLVPAWLYLPFSLVTNGETKRHGSSDRLRVLLYPAPYQLWESFSANTESLQTLSVRYLTTLSQQMLTAIKHVADDEFCVQQDSTLAHHACNTVKLQESKLSTSLLSIMAFNLTAQQ